jgi:hypothetical protein
MRGPSPESEIGAKLQVLALVNAKVGGISKRIRALVVSWDAEASKYRQCGTLCSRSRVFTSDDGTYLTARVRRKINLLSSSV